MTAQASQRGRDQQRPPVHRVGHGAAVQPQDHQRDQRGQPDQPDPEGRAGHVVHLHRDGHGGQLEPDERHALADEQPAEVRVPQRPDVDGDPTQRGGP